MTKWGLSQECKDGLTLKKEPMRFTILELKRETIISTDAEKADKIWHLFLNKN